MNVELVSPVKAAEQRTETTIKRLWKKSRPNQRHRKRIKSKKVTALVRKRKRSVRKGRKTVR